MMNLWLVLLGAVFLHEASKMNETPAVVTRYLGYGCLLISVILVFVNGGTTG